jgi:hypothetical protein
MKEGMKRSGKMDVLIVQATTLGPVQHVQGESAASLDITLASNWQTRRECNPLAKVAPDTVEPADILEVETHQSLKPKTETYAIYARRYRKFIFLPGNFFPCSSLILRPLESRRSRHLMRTLHLLPGHRIEDLARVHQPLRIEAPFQRAHDADGVEAQFVDQALFLA